MADNKVCGIGNNVANKLQLAYPDDPYEMIVISAGPTDRKAEVVHQGAETSGGPVCLLIHAPCQVNTAALIRVMPEAGDQLLVFSAANSSRAPEVFSRLVGNFWVAQLDYRTRNRAYRVTVNAGIGYWQERPGTATRWTPRTSLTGRPCWVR